MSLIHKFQAIDSVLQFHHSTNARPLAVNEVASRVKKLTGLEISRQTVQDILEVMPSAYQLDQANASTWLISSADLPRKLHERRKEFSDRVGVRSLPSPPLPEKTMHKPAAPRLVGKTPSRVIKGTLKPANTNVPKPGDILTRIRMKEAALKRARDPAVIREQRVKFLTALLPSVTAVLESLSTTRQSFALDEIIDRVSTSMKTRLSPREISDTVQLLAETRPGFCSLLESGSITVVKLSI